MTDDPAILQTLLDLIRTDLTISPLRLFRKGPDCFIDAAPCIQTLPLDTLIDARTLARVYPIAT